MSNLILSDSSTDVVLNVTKAFSISYPAEVTQHPIEKEGDASTVSDHVVVGQRGVSLSCVLSSTTDILSLSYMSTYAKMNQLIDWQTRGQILSLLGYESKNLLKQILSLLPESLRYKQIEPTARFLGRMNDEIPNLILGDISHSDAPETGDDESVEIMLFPAIIAEAKTATFQRAPSKGRTATKSVSKDSSSATTNPAKKSMLTSIFG